MSWSASGVGRGEFQGEADGEAIDRGAMAGDKGRKGEFGAELCGLVVEPVRVDMERGMILLKLLDRELGGRGAITNEGKGGTGWPDGWQSSR